MRELRGAWEGLKGCAGIPMETFGWSAAAAESLTDEQSPRLILAERDGSVCGIGQLAACRRSLSGRLEMIGMTRLNEPDDFLCADRETLATLVSRATRLRRPIFLGRLPAGSPTIEEFRRASIGRGTVLVRPQASCPVITLDETWREPESHLSSKRRSDFRRAGRRAEQQGTVTAEVLAPTVDELGRLLGIALAVEARSWKGKAGTALVNDPIRGRQIRGFATWAAQAGILRIALLRIGDIYAAMQIAAEHNNAYWLLKIGFDPAVGNCSPGNLLLAESLRYSAEKGLRTLEFLGTVEPWTKVWTDEERKCVSLRYYPFNLRGIAALVSDGAGKLIRRFRSQHASQSTGVASNGEES